MHGLISCGGGRSEHKLADGDFPTCIAMRIMSGSGGRPVLGGPDHSIPTGRNDHATNAEKCERAVGTPPGNICDGSVEAPIPAHLGEDPEYINFRCLLKNVMSIMTEERERQLLHELDGISWDIILLNETWRSKVVEIWTSTGHLFLGAGGTAHSAGVAIILNRRWVRGFQGFKRVSERLCALDLKVSGRKLRFIVPYMPTTWHPDAPVEGIYGELSKLCDEAKAQGRLVTVGGDFNAVIGTRRHGDSKHIVGDHGLGWRNDRGQRLVDWATAENLMILNTKLRKPIDKQWTHQRGGHRRLIDYFLCQKCRWIEVRNLEATYDINLGTDHRSVSLHLRIKIPQASRNKSKNGKAVTSLRG